MIELHATPTARPGTESPLPRLVSEVFRESPPPLRARLLEQLLRPVRRLGLAAVAAGVFALFLHPERWRALAVSVDDALRFTGDQVFELARFVEQVQPEALTRLVQALVDGGDGLPMLGGSLLLLALQLASPDPAGQGTPAEIEAPPGPRGSTGSAAAG